MKNFTRTLAIFCTALFLAAGCDSPTSTNNNIDTGDTVAAELPDTQQAQERCDPVPEDEPIRLCATLVPDGNGGYTVNMEAVMGGEYTFEFNEAGEAGEVCTLDNRPGRCYTIMANLPVKVEGTRQFATTLSRTADQVQSDREERVQVVLDAAVAGQTQRVRRKVLLVHENALVQPTLTRGQ